MIIQAVEEYHNLELKAMPHVSYMLFPDQPVKEPRELKLPPLEVESIQTLDEEKNRKFIRTKQKSDVDNYRLRRGWLARRSFVAMDAIHAMVFRHTKSLSDDAKGYIFSKFDTYLYRQGGWRNIIQDAAYDIIGDMRSVTFLQASKGILAGHVLKYCLNNNCGTEEASHYIAEEVTVENNDDYILDDFIFDDNVFDDKERLVTPPSVKIHICKKKYSSGYIRQVVWNEMKNVSYAWAAAVDIFGDTSSFTNRMIASARPFEFSNIGMSESAGYAEFIRLAKHYRSLATSKRRSSKRALHPLIKRPSPSLFG